MGEAQRFCVWCGHVIKPGGRFCTACGRALRTENEVPAAAGTMPPPAMPPPAAAPPVAEPAGPPAQAAFAGPPAEPNPWLPRDAPTQWAAQAPPVAPPPPEPTVPPDGHKRDRRRWPVVVAVLVLLAGGGGGAGWYFLHHSAHKNNAHTSAEKNAHPVAAAHSATPSPSASPSTMAPTEQQAAQALAALLGKSVADRSSVVNAVSDVADCGSGLSHDAQVFQQAASSRQALLSQLVSLPGQASLPASMMQALTSAWQASVQADQDFAQWAQDEAAQGCVRNDHADPGYQAASGPDRQATSNKKAFARQWNPLAAQYGLTPYKWSQL